MIGYLFLPERAFIYLYILAILGSSCNPADNSTNKNEFNIHDEIKETHVLGVGDSDVQVILTKKQKDTAIKKITENMILIKGGTFYMGSNQSNIESDKPAHKVYISPFKLSKYELSQIQWEAVMGNNPSFFKDCNDCPVENVSWRDAQLFIAKLNQATSNKFRLPTEAEWEYAAKGGEKSMKYKFSGSNEIEQIAWVKENSNNRTHPLGQKLPNELGICDMTGNVWEWCADLYDEKYYKTSPNDNPKGPSEYLKGVAGHRSYVLRGGAYGITKDFISLLNTYRSCDHPDSHYKFRGFRLAEDL